MQLQPFGDRIMLGYGEWDIGLDHCSLVAWNTQTTSFEDVLTDVATDAFWTLRVVNNQLWALVTDPSVGTDPDAVIFDGVTARLLADPNLTPWHLFDIHEWNGSLYLAGANRVIDESRGAVWRSKDGGYSWHVVFESIENIRIHALFDFGEMLFAVGLRGETWTTSDGEDWQPISVDLLPRGSVCVDPIVVAGQVAYLNGWPAYGPQDLCAFDGNESRLLDDVGTVVGADSDGASITVLTTERGILQSTDLTTWDLISETVPANGRSICTHNGSLYLGTADSHLWQFDAEA